jgi:hypothetical protein
VVAARAVVTCTVAAHKFLVRALATWVLATWVSATWVPATWVLATLVLATLVLATLVLATRAIATRAAATHADAASTYRMWLENGVYACTDEHPRLGSIILRIQIPAST